jgi:hypothetical protein
MEVRCCHTGGRGAKGYGEGRPCLCPGYDGNFKRIDPFDEGIYELHLLPQLRAAAEAWAGNAKGVAECCPWCSFVIPAEQGHCGTCDKTCGLGGDELIGDCDALAIALVEILKKLASKDWENTNCFRCLYRDELKCIERGLERFRANKVQIIKCTLTQAPLPLWPSGSVPISQDDVNACLWCNVHTGDCMSTIHQNVSSRGIARIYLCCANWNQSTRCKSLHAGGVGCSLLHALLHELIHAGGSIAECGDFLHDRYLTDDPFKELSRSAAGTFPGLNTAIDCLCGPPKK